MSFRVLVAAIACLALALTFTAPAGAAAVSPPPPLLTALASTPVGRVAVPAAQAVLQDGAKLLADAGLGESNVLVGLRLRNESALQRLITEVSDPRSSHYGHYLTPAQFRARFSPDMSEVDAVTAFAHRFGLRVASVPRNRLWVQLTGPGAAASKAFAAALRVYHLTTGQDAVMPSVIPSVPKSLSRIVTGIQGLDTSDIIRPAATTSPPAHVTAGPCSTYWAQHFADGIPGANGDPGPLPYTPCGYTPKQLAGAYGLTSAHAAGIDGRGVTVGIIDAWASPTIVSDVNTWSDRHGLAKVDLQDISGPLVGLVPDVPLPIDLIDPYGWAGEQTLDVEAVHAMAPGAKIVYSGTLSPISSQFTQAQNDMVDNARAQIVTNSYGGNEDDADANTDAVLAQAAAQGIGFYFASGDEGDETKDPNGPNDREVSNSANNPMATGVGGTSLAVGQDDNYVFETGWGTFSTKLAGSAWSPAPPGNFMYGGGGGTSQSYGEPDYQKGVVPDSIAGFFNGKPAELSQGSGFKPAIPGRAVPDIAMDGDPDTGLLVGITQDFSSGARMGIALPGDDVHYNEYRLGGTSLSSPLFAGIMALADQAAGKPHGFVNPALYAAYKADHSIVRDIVNPPKTVSVVRIDYVNNLDASGGINTLLHTFNQTNTIHTAPGFDDVTGLGTPNGLYFLHALAPGSTKLPPLPAGGSSASCKKGKSLTIKLKVPKGRRIVRVTVRLGNDKARVVRGHALKSVRVKLPSKTRKLQITTLTNRKKTSKSTRYLGPCGVVKAPAKKS